MMRFIQLPRGELAYPPQIAFRTRSGSTINSSSGGRLGAELPQALCGLDGAKRSVYSLRLETLCRG